MALVLENVRSGRNVGSILRTADAFALAEVVMVGYTPVPPHREILKTSLGAEASVPWRHFGDIEDAVDTLRQEGWRVLALEQTTGGVDVRDVRFGESRLAFVVGNEVRGVSQEALALVDGAVEIGQYGMKHSLNVGVAAGVVAYLGAAGRGVLRSADRRTRGGG